MEQKRIAESLVQRCHTRDPFRIARDLGFLIIRCPLTGIRGFCQRLQRQKLLYIDSALTEPEARFVCAHELGHMLLHKGYNRIFMDSNTYFPVNRQEIEANRFAVFLLYDDGDLRFFLEHPVQLAADYLGVSVELAEYRLRHIDQ